MWNKQIKAAVVIMVGSAQLLLFSGDGHARPRPGREDQGQGRPDLQARHSAGRSGQKGNEELLQAIYQNFYQNRFQELRPMLVRYLQQYPGSAQEESLYMILAISYQQLGDEDNAFICLDRLIYQPTSTMMRGRALLMKGNWLYQKNQWAQAALAYEDLMSMRIRVEDGQELSGRLKSIYQQRKQLEKIPAIESWMEEVYPDCPDKSDSDRLPMRSSGKYVVQIAAFSSLLNAKKYQKQLTQKGYQVYCQKDNGSTGSPLYRVQMGPFSSQVEAQKLLAKLQNKEKIRARLIEG